MNTALEKADSRNIQSAGAAPGFDYLLPAGQQWFTLAQIARVIERSESFVAKLYEEGRLLSGHSFRAGTGQRATKRVPRCFVVSLLVKTADYDEEIKLQAFLSCLSEFSAARLRQIATVANGLAATRQRAGFAGRKVTSAARSGAGHIVATVSPHWSPGQAYLAGKGKAANADHPLDAIEREIDEQKKLNE